MPSYMRQGMNPENCTRILSIHSRYRKWPCIVMSHNQYIQAHVYLPWIAYTKLMVDDVFREVTRQVYYAAMLFLLQNNICKLMVRYVGKWKILLCRVLIRLQILASKVQQWLKPIYKSYELTKMNVFHEATQI